MSEKEVILKCPHCNGETDHDNSFEYGMTLKRIAGPDDILTDTIELKEIWYCLNCENLFEVSYKFDKITPLVRKEL